MQKNERLIQKFYQAFQNKDYEGMKACYSEEVTFSDPVFYNLNYKEVSKMWEMLIKAGKDLQLEFSDIKGEGNQVRAKWTAKYTFSQTSKKVVNHIQAQFELKDGKIIRHRDSFNFYVWARQAFGLSAWAIGWTQFFQNKVAQGALKGLKSFMKKNP